MKLSPGDTVHYPANRAFGLLLKRCKNFLGEPTWEYALMSPKPGGTRYLIKIDSASEEQFLESIGNGRLEYYAKSG